MGGSMTRTCMRTPVSTSCQDTNSSSMSSNGIEVQPGGLTTRYKRFNANYLLEHEYCDRLRICSNHMSRQAGIVQGTGSFPLGALFMYLPPVLCYL